MADSFINFFLKPHIVPRHFQSNIFKDQKLALHQYSQALRSMEPMDDEALTSLGRGAANGDASQHTVRLLNTSTWVAIVRLLVLQDPDLDRLCARSRQWDIKNTIWIGNDHGFSCSWWQSLPAARHLIRDLFVPTWAQFIKRGTQIASVERGGAGYCVDHCSGGQAQDYDISTISRLDARRCVRRPISSVDSVEAWEGLGQAREPCEPFHSSTVSATRSWVLQHRPTGQGWFCAPPSSHVAWHFL